MSDSNPSAPPITPVTTQPISIGWQMASQAGWQVQNQINGMQTQNNQEGNFRAFYPPPLYSPEPHPDRAPPFYPSTEVFNMTNGADPPITQQPEVVTKVIIQNVTLGPDPMNLHCPVCQKEVITRIELKIGKTTHLAAAASYAITDDVCCALCIYCCDCCNEGIKDILHYCSQCDHYYGKAEPKLF